MNETKKNTAAKIFIWSLLIGVAGYATAVTAAPVLLNHFISEYNLASAQQGLTNSMYQLGGIVAIFLTMLLLGRVKKIQTLLICISIQALLFVATGLSTAFFALLISTMLLGLFAGMFDTYANSCIVDVSKENSAKYLGAFHGLFGAGSLLTPLIIQSALLATDWRGTYFILAVIVGIIAIQLIIVTRLTGKKIDLDGMDEKKLTGIEIKAYFKSKRNVLLLLACVLYTAGQMGLLGWIVRYMTVSFDAELLGATAITVYWIFAVISRLGAPKLGIDPMKLHIFGAALSGIVFFAAILLNNAVIMCVCAGIIGLLGGPCFPMLLSVSMTEYRGRTLLPTSVIFFVSRIAWMLLPLLQGALSSPQLVNLSMIIPAVMTMLSAFAGWAVCRSRS